MTLDELVEHFDKVRVRGRGFTARCPAHDDRTPSLSVTEGATSWLVSCHTGCSFFDIVSAAGLSPLDFKIDSEPHMANDVTSMARFRMTEMRRCHGVVLETFGEIVEKALDPPADVYADVCRRWEIMSMPFGKAMGMWHVAMDGPIWDLTHHAQRWVKDWSVEKNDISRVLYAANRKWGMA